MTKFYQTPFGQFDINRIPDNDKNLQAWNSADLYLLNSLFEKVESGLVDLEKANILIMNDDFGALTLPMIQFCCDTYSDSFIAHEAIRQNIKLNCPELSSGVRLIKSTDILDKQYDVVLFKNIKTQVFLQDEMMKLAEHIHADTFILGASMAKNLQKSTLTMLSKTIGDAQSSLTWKKARLITIQPHLKHKPYCENKATYYLEPGNETIHSLANVFSRNKLDIGTRFFLEHLPLTKQPEPESIIDLGCGNGVLALKLAQCYLNAHITCVDESYMAVASAQLTLESNIECSERQIDYIAGNALTEFSGNSTDLILCNPPFHQQYVVGDGIAWQMFKQSQKVLKKGGELWIVGNRHLDYHMKLKKIFGNQKLIAANNKFVILKAIKN